MKSKKQQAKDRAYKKAKIERAEELKAEGKWVCIFTGHPIPDYLTGDKVECHHLKSRTGELLCDKKFFGFYLDRTFHNAYHDKSFSELKAEWWWKGFLSRVKDIDKDLWYNLHLK